MKVTNEKAKIYTIEGKNKLKLFFLMLLFLLWFAFKNKCSEQTRIGLRIGDSTCYAKIFISRINIDSIKLTLTVVNTSNENIVTTCPGSSYIDKIFKDSAFKLNISVGEFNFTYFPHWPKTKLLIIKPGDSLSNQIVFKEKLNPIRIQYSFDYGYEKEVPKQLAHPPYESVCSNTQLFISDYIDYSKRYKLFLKDTLINKL